MATACVVDYAPGLPAELRAISPCEHGLVLLRVFGSAEALTSPAQPYCGFQGDPLWRVFTGRAVFACQEDGSFRMSKCGSQISTMQDRLFVALQRAPNKRKLSYIPPGCPSRVNFRDCDALLIR